MSWDMKQCFRPARKMNSKSPLDLFKACLCNLQGEVDNLKTSGKGHMKADLQQRVVSFPQHLQEAVANTPEHFISLSAIRDRQACENV